MSLSLLAVLLCGLVADRIFEGLPHIEDEFAYAWQAAVIVKGRLTIPSPPHPKSFLIPFVVDYNGQRFGKYPPGWPIVLSLGVFLGVRFLVNPLLAGLGVWLTYLLGRRLFSEWVGVLAAGLTITSPFFLMNSGSLLSHPLGLVLSAVFALAWLGVFFEKDSKSDKRANYKRWWATVAAALSLWALILTRPFTAVGVALPFAIHGLGLFFRRDRSTRSRLLVLAGISLALASLYFLWQYAVTGNALLNPYTLWWSYDKVGFGPGHGHLPEGHTLSHAYANTYYSLAAGARDLFGWGKYSWIFLPFGLWVALRKDRWGPGRNWKALILFSVFLSLVLAHTLYWVGATLYGPRYYYESLYSLTLFSAAGIASLAGWRVSPSPFSGKSPSPAIGGEEVIIPPPKPGAEPAVGGDRVGDDQPLTSSNRLSRDRLNSREMPILKWFNVFSGRPKLRAGLIVSLLVGLMLYNLAVTLPARMREMQGLYGIQRSGLEPFVAAQAQGLAPALVFVHSEEWMPYGAFLDLEDPFLTTPIIFAWSINPERDQEAAAVFPGRTVYQYYPEGNPWVLYKGWK